jgi:ubiquinone biosynthesis protein
VSILTRQKARSSKYQAASKGSDYFALTREIVHVYRQLVLSGVVRFPVGMLRSIVRDSGLDPIWSEKHLFDLVGDIVLSCMDQLGPVYGKIGQVALSRIGDHEQEWVQKLRLDRLYGSWPALPFREIEAVLDVEIPDWHQEFVIEPHPLGVASMAQVHAAVDESGREWVIKVIKPESKRRLEETLRALERIIVILKPMKLTLIGARTIRELEELIRALRHEVHLDLEKKNLEKMRSRFDLKKLQVLRLPQTNDAFCTVNVLVIERFRGTPLVDVVEGRVELKPEQRKKLARKILQELLVQVFELGLFHGDPHAGNLMLLEDGSVGIFDWGLTGELRDGDRRHISGILKALLLADMQRLIDVLVAIAAEHQVSIKRQDVESEIRRVAQILQNHKQAGTQASLEELLEAALKSSEQLGIPVPDGLLMMAKSLLTIEGLARGIDPEVSFARVAGPVLLKAARPSLGDVITMGRRLPGLMRKIFASPGD